MWFVGALLAVLIAIIGHGAICRVPVAFNVVTRFLIVGGMVGAGLLWALIRYYGALAPQTWAGVLVYGFCCELYLFLFTLAMSSVSANLLINLSRRAMTDSEIERLYDSRQMVMTRLDRLVAADLLVETPSGLQKTPKGLRMVRIFNYLRDFFRHPSPTQNRPPD